MSGMWGNKFQISIFGESHGEAVGITLWGIPAGLEIDMEFIKSELLRRAGGHDQLSTPRLEKDEFRFISGVFNGKASGSPICCIIPNTNVRSKDYDKIKNFMRPSHADYTAYVKYGGHADYRGGGHFSGRITAGLVVAGAIAKMYLKQQGISISGRVVTENLEEKILQAKADLDSVGGKVEIVAEGVPAGVGEPFFNSVESVMAHLLFSIPGVKGVEFGAGFALANMRGSEANDEFYIENGQVKTRTNNAGGINGGISNGMPIVARVAFRPTTSIKNPQNTIDIEAMQPVTYAVEGRHDPCIARRGVVVAESAVAIALAELML